MTHVAKLSGYRARFPHGLRMAHNIKFRIPISYFRRQLSTNNKNHRNKGTTLLWLSLLSQRMFATFLWVFLCNHYFFILQSVWFQSLSCSYHLMSLPVGVFSNPLVECESSPLSYSIDLFIPSFSWIMQPPILVLSFNHEWNQGWNRTLSLERSGNSGNSSAWLKRWNAKHNEVAMRSEWRGSDKVTLVSLCSVDLKWYYGELSLSLSFRFSRMCTLLFAPLSLSCRDQ